ncbi:nuclear transport factor 2 family protein [Adhaeribacter aquaticus]|uniref:nuclear transport factor 2 family protein n=1 Tax=Adhaeribacter aquaticus TaxID=299567 RepID=UPI00047ACF7A|nr:nuclear transport factor 2 family protein [Adhaeribacter aquaticus]
MEVQKKQIVESYVNAYNNFDIDGMTKNLDENIVFENVSDGKVDLRTEGLKSFREQAESAKQYFKQRKQTIESWEFRDSIAMINIDYKAILAIDLPNGLNSGDTLELKGKSEFEFEDGKIKRITDKS